MISQITSSSSRKRTSAIPRSSAAVTVSGFEGSALSRAFALGKAHAIVGGRSSSAFPASATLTVSQSAPIRSSVSATTVSVPGAAAHAVAVAVADVDRVVARVGRHAVDARSAR